MRIKALDECITELSRLPGIGRKTALRLAMHMLKMKNDDVKRLSEKIVSLKSKVVFCEKCNSLSESVVCSLCSDESRANGQLCVVEEAKDVFVIEQTSYYKGRYHVLGGKISPLDGIGPDKLYISDLLKRVVQENIFEVIMATNPDVDGETTALYIMRLLKDFPQVKITKIASGIPLGSHIEYADEFTILRALEGRREIG